MKTYSKLFFSFMLFFVIASSYAAFGNDTLIITIKNDNFDKLHAVPSVTNLHDGKTLFPKELKNLTNVENDKNLNSSSWSIMRNQLGDKFRISIVNGHLGLIKNIVYYEEHNINNVGDEINIILKPFIIDMEITVDSSLTAPTEDSFGSVGVYVQLFKIDDCGEVMLSEKIPKVSEIQYKNKILVFQSGQYWIEVRYTGKKIKGENEFLGYPVWGKTIQISNDSIMKVVGNTEKK